MAGRNVFVNLAKIPITVVSERLIICNVFILKGWDYSRLEVPKLGPFLHGLVFYGTAKKNGTAKYCGPSFFLQTHELKAP